MAIIGRLNKLEEKMKLIEDDLVKKKEQRQWNEYFFHSMNVSMEQHYPKHGWCKIPIKKRLEIHNKPTNKKKYFRPNCPIPILIPDKDKNTKLYEEALRLYGDFIWEEIKRRREKEYLKSDVESKGMKGKYKYK